MYLRETWDDWASRESVASPGRIRNGGCIPCSPSPESCHRGNFRYRTGRLVRCSTLEEHGRFLARKLRPPTLEAANHDHSTPSCGRNLYQALIADHPDQCAHRWL